VLTTTFIGLLDCISNFSSENQENYKEKYLAGHLVSISSMFFARVFVQIFGAKPNVTRENDVRTKNSYVKHWWNWLLKEAYGTLCVRSIVLVNKFKILKYIIAGGWGVNFILVYS
jgi:hypothetical protein